MPSTKNGKKSLDKPTNKDSMVFDEKNLTNEELTEGSREFYRVQIRDLEERLEKYQHKCDELEVRARDFSSRYEALEKEKKDIVLFLKRSLNQREDENAEISGQLKRLEERTEKERESLEMQLSQLRQEFQENKDNLTAENMVLAGKLAALEEFRMHKESLEARLEELESQLEKERQEHQDTVVDMERKALMDKDRLKKEMEQHVATVAAELRNVSDRNMPETTKRAIRENVVVTGELQQLSTSLKELLKENEALRTREKQLRQEKDLLEPMLNEMTRKNLGNQKVMHLLTEKCKQMQAELKECSQSREEYRRLSEAHSALQTEHESLRLKQASTLEELGRKQAEAEKLRKELEGERTLRGQLETLVEEAAMVLKEVLKEEPKEEDSEIQSVVRRSQLTQRLLAVLNAALGKDSAHSDSVHEAHHHHKTEPTAEKYNILYSGLSALGSHHTQC
ncbi:cilia- and flagella-associated protein 157 [Chanos chanos]|uniref:Cilia- and flagella-associated protein 157 n=1 Tax=Chanos chanos TaxID=29144 RepID=A0A6J2VI78_CHACN|nr:cilia- and flagella-associated protein 157 [Chanos chanos]